MVQITQTTMLEKKRMDIFSLGIQHESRIFGDDDEDDEEDDHDNDEENEDPDECYHMAF